jgi:hypothetical protein
MRASITRRRRSVTNSTSNSSARANSRVGDSGNRRKPPAFGISMPSAIALSSLAMARIWVCSIALDRDEQPLIGFGARQSLQIADARDSPFTTRTDGIPWMGMHTS